jgi:hypothetical protein
MDNLEARREAGALVANTIVYAEVSGHFTVHDELQKVFSQVGIELENIPWEAAYLAGRIYRAYRRKGGLRERVLPDFLIGAHANVKGYSLLTRDASRYRSYFPDLDIIAPDTHP